MDRKDEILELTSRLVSLILEEREEMRREIEKLRETVEKLGAETVRKVTVEVVPEPEPEFEAEYETGKPAEPERKPEPEPEQEPEPEPEREEPQEIQDPDSQVLRPRNRQEQMEDTTEWGGNLMGPDLNINFDDDSDEEPIMGNLFDFEEKKQDPKWMTDVPESGVKSIYEALSNNDRIRFIRDLFDEDGEQFSFSMDRIDGCSDFRQVVKEMRIAFPEWDEHSEVVYDFYMTVKRKFI